MEKKVFGYPQYIDNCMTLTTYDNEYRDMNMDIRVYRLKQGDQLEFESETEEIAVLLLNGNIDLEVDEQVVNASRTSVFLEGPFAAHCSCNHSITVVANAETEILVQKTRNENDFASKIYQPNDAPWKYSSQGKFGNVANRRVNTIFDKDIEPKSMMVLGEVLNDPGNWSGYLPHRHRQPECYYFLFDHPEGFGASFVGDEVYKSTHKSFSAIPGGALHPQSVAPGYQMYTCWMIAHFEDNPWLQTDRNEDEAFIWLHDAEFDSKTNSFVKK